MTSGTLMPNTTRRHTGAVALYTCTMARGAPRRDSMVRRISSSRACVITMMVTSSGISFCSMRSRTVWKSVSDADGKPTSISLRPTAHSVLNSRFLVSRLMGSNSAWLPSRRSVLHHTGTVLAGAWATAGWAGRWRERAVFLRRIFQHDCFSAGRGRDFPALGSSQGSSLVSADWWRVCVCG